MDEGRISRGKWFEKYVGISQVKREEYFKQRNYMKASSERGSTVHSWDRKNSTWLGPRVWRGKR